MSRVLTPEQREAKNAHDRERRARLKALGIDYRNVGDGFLIEESRVERKEKARVAAACALPFRDAHAHVRGGAFKHEAGEADATSRTATDFMTGDKTSYRGTGFYAGRRTHV